MSESTKAEVASDTKAEPKEKASTIEQLAGDLNVPAWAAAALKARQGWPIGKKLLPSDYKAKLKELMDGHTDGDQ